MAPKKINIKERFTDGEIDLSMSDLAEVPVKDIVWLFYKIHITYYILDKICF